MNVRTRDRTQRLLDALREQRYGTGRIERDQPGQKGLHFVRIEENVEYPPVFLGFTYKHAIERIMSGSVKKGGDHDTS